MDGGVMVGARHALEALFECGPDEVRSACADDRIARRDAWMGDVEVKHIISKTLFAQKPEACAGELSELRARYEANEIMAWFLRDGTDHDCGSKSVHMLGTSFEALVQRASSACAPQNLQKLRLSSSAHYLTLP